MSRLHSHPKRHSATARDHGAIAWVLALLVGAIAFYPTFMYFNVTGVLGTIESSDFTPLLPPDTRPSPPPEDSAAGQWINILLMGSDTRAGENAALGGEENSLANDTTIIMHISADRSRVEMVSIPRDSQVRLPGCIRSDGTRTYPETQKFNHAFGIGGMNGSIGDAAACVIRTVEDATGIYISDYVVIDFVGVRDVVNVLGGVPMCIPFNVSSPKAQLTLQAGPQILDGVQALSWARARTLDFESSADRRAFEKVYGSNGLDPARIKRQQELIGKIFEVMLHRNLLIHPKELTSLLEAAADSMTVSPNMKEFDYLVGLAWSLRGIDKANIVFTTVPWKMHPNNTDVVWLPEADDIFAAIQSDQPISAIADIDLQTVAEMSDAAPTPVPTASTGPDVTPEPTAADEATDLLGACTVGQV